MKDDFKNVKMASDLAKALEYQLLSGHIAEVLTKDPGIHGVGPQALVGAMAAGISNLVTVAVEDAQEKFEEVKAVDLDEVRDLVIALNKPLEGHRTPECIIALATSILARAAVSAMKDDSPKEEVGAQVTAG